MRMRNRAAPWALRLLAAANQPALPDRKSTRLNSSHSQISYAVFCLKKKCLKAGHKDGQDRKWRHRQEDWHAALNFSRSVEQDQDTGLTRLDRFQTNHVQIRIHSRA